MKYAKRNELIDVEFNGDDGILVTDASGNEVEFTKEYLEAFYVPVSTHEKDVEYSLEDIARGYMEMGELIKNENEEDYIFEIENK